MAMLYNSITESYDACFKSCYIVSLTFVFTPEISSFCSLILYIGEFFLLRLNPISRIPLKNMFKDRVLSSDSNVGANVSFTSTVHCSNTHQYLMYDPIFKSSDFTFIKLYLVINHKFVVFHLILKKQNLNI